MKTQLEKYRDDFPVLRSERLLLRRPVTADAPAFFKAFSDEEVMRHFNRDAMQQLEEAEKLLTLFETVFQRGDGIRWAIVPLGAHEPAGSIGFHTPDPKHPFQGEIGYELQRAFWGKGYATEAIGLIAPFGLHELGLERIQARTMTNNPASARTLEKNGFRFEGLLRKHGWWKNQLHDLNCYSLIKNDLA